MYYDQDERQQNNSGNDPGEDRQQRRENSGQACRESPETGSSDRPEHNPGRGDKGDDG